MRFMDRGKVFQPFKPMRLKSSLVLIKLSSRSTLDSTDLAYIPQSQSQLQNT